MKLLIALVVLVGCSALPTHNAEPRGCRERIAFKLAEAYPDPNNLAIALDAICPVLDNAVTTTTRNP